MLDPNEKCWDDLLNYAILKDSILKPQPFPLNKILA